MRSSLFRKCLVSGGLVAILLGKVSGFTVSSLSAFPDSFPLTRSFSGKPVPIQDTSVIAVDYSVRIIGHAPGAEGREVVWKTDADDISHRFLLLDRARIDSDGRFELETDQFTGTRCTYLEIDYYSASLFVETGKTYRMEFSKFNYHLDDGMNAFVPSNNLPDLPYVLQDEHGQVDRNELNYLLGRYSYLYQRMMSRHFEEVTVLGNVQPIVDFLVASQEELGQVDHDFFQAYRKFNEAGLKDFGGLMTRRELFEAYIDSQSYDRFNPAQRDFYETFYAQYFQTNPFLPFDQFRRIINRPSYTTAQRREVLLDSMGLDYSLRNEKLREWVLVLGLTQEMHNDRLNTPNMIAMLRDISRSSKFKDIAQAAGNYIKAREEDWTRPYFKDIVLTDTAGNTIRVEDFLEKGKFHYFVFIRAAYANCQTCAEELHLLQKIWEEVGEQVKDAVNVVVIDCDYTHAQYYHDAVSRHYPWPYVHFNGNIDWIRKIDAARFPSFYLVDDKGNVLNSEFNAPSQNIADVFRRMATLKSLQERRMAE